MVVIVPVHMDYLCLLKWPYQKSSLSKLQPCEQNHQGHDEAVFGGIFQPLREACQGNFTALELFASSSSAYSCYFSLHSPFLCTTTLWPCLPSAFQKWNNFMVREERFCACKGMAPLSKPQWLVRILCSQGAELPLPAEQMLWYENSPHLATYLLSCVLNPVA